MATVNPSSPSSSTTTPSGGTSGADAAAVSSAQSGVTSAQQKVDTAASGITTLEAAATSLDGQVAPAQTAYTEAQTASSTLGTDLTTAQTAVTTATTASTTAQTAYDTATTAATTATTAVTTAQTAATTADTAFTTANTAYTTAQTAKKTAQTDYTTAQTAATTAQTDYTTAQTAATTAGTAYTTAQTATQTATTGYTTAQTATTTATTAYTTAQTTTATATTAYGTAQTASTTAQTGVTTAKATLTTADGAVTTAQGDVTKANSAVTTATGALSTATGAVTTAKSRVSTAEGKVGSAQSDVSSAEGELSRAQARLNDPKDTGAQAAVNAAQGKLSAARGRLSAAKGEVTSAKAALTQAQTAETQAKAALERAKTEAEAAKRRLVAAQEKQKAAKEAVTKAEAALKAAKEAEAEAKTALDKAKADELKAKTALDKAKADELKAKTALDKAKEAETKAKTALDKAKEAETKAKTALDTATEAETKAKTALDTAREAQTKAKGDLTKAKDAETKAKTAQTTAKDNLDKAKEAVTKAQAKLTDVKTKVDAAKAEVDAAKAKLDDATSKASAKKTELATARSSLASARSELTAAQARLTAAQDKAKPKLSVQTDSQATAAEDAKKKKAQAAAIDAAVTPEEKARLLADQKALADQEAKIRAQEAEAKTTPISVRGLDPEDRRAIQAANTTNTSNTTAQITNARETYYKTHDYYVDADGTTYVATVNPTTGDVKLERDDEQPAKPATATAPATPATTSNRTATIKVDNSRQDVAVTKTVPTGKPDEVNQTRTETVNTAPNGKATDSQIRLEQERKNKDGSTDTSKTEENYNATGIATSREQEQRHLAVNGDSTRDDTKTTFAADGKTAAQTVVANEQRTAGTTSNRETTTNLAADGATPKDQTIVESGTDKPTTTAHTGFTAAGEPATTFISRDANGTELPNGITPTEYVVWGADGKPSKRLTGGTAITEGEYSTFATTGTKPAVPSAGTEPKPEDFFNDDLDIDDFDDATKKFEDAHKKWEDNKNAIQTANAFNEVDPASIPGTEDPIKWTRGDGGRFKGEPLQGNLVAPLTPSGTTPSVFDVPAQLQTRASAAAIDQSPPATDKAAFAKLDTEQHAYETQVAGAKTDAERQQIMSAYFADHPYWIDRGPKPDSQPVLEASAWSNGTPGSTMFGGSRAANPHATMARTGISGQDDQGQPATLDIVTNRYIDGTKDDVTRTSYDGPAGASRVVVTGEHSNAAGVITERDRNAQSQVARTKEGLEPLAVTEISKERFNETTGKPQGEQYYAVAQSDSRMTSLEEKKDYYTTDGIIFDTKIEETQESRNWDAGQVNDFLGQNQSIIDRARTGKFNPNEDGTNVTVPAAGSFYAHTNTDIDYDATGVAIHEQVDSQTSTVADAGDENHNGVKITATDTHKELGTPGGTAPIFDADGRRIVNEVSTGTIKTTEYDPDAGTAGGNHGLGHQFRENTSVTYGTTTDPAGKAVAGSQWSTPLTTQTLREGFDNDWIFEEKQLKTEPGKDGAPFQLVIDGEGDDAHPVEVRYGDEVYGADGKKHELERPDNDPFGDGPSIHHEDLDFADKFEEFMEGWGGKIIGGLGVVAGLALIATGVGSPLGVALAAGGVALATTQFAYTALNYSQGEASGLDLVISGAGVVLSAIPAITGVRQLAATGRAAEALNAARAAGATEEVAQTAASTILREGTENGRAVETALKAGEVTEKGLDGKDAYDAGRAALQGDFYGAGLMLIAVGGGSAIGRVRSRVGVPGPTGAPDGGNPLPDTNLPGTPGNPTGTPDTNLPGTPGNGAPSATGSNGLPTNPGTGTPGSSTNGGGASNPLPTPDLNGPTPATPRPTAPSSSTSTSSGAPTVRTNPAPDTTSTRRTLGGDNTGSPAPAGGGNGAPAATNAGTPAATNAGGTPDGTSQVAGARGDGAASTTPATPTAPTTPALATTAPDGTAGATVPASDISPEWLRVNGDRVGRPADLSRGEPGAVPYTVDAQGNVNGYGVIGADGTADFNVTLQRDGTWAVQVPTVRPDGGRFLNNRTPIARPASSLEAPSPLSDADVASSVAARSDAVRAGYPDPTVSTDVISHVARRHLPGHMPSDGSLGPGQAIDGAGNIGYYTADGIFHKEDFTLPAGQFRNGSTVEDVQGLVQDTLDRGVWTRDASSGAARVVLRHDSTIGVDADGVTPANYTEVIVRPDGTVATAYPVADPNLRGALAADSGASVPARTTTPTADGAATSPTAAGAAAAPIPGAPGPDAPSIFGIGREVPLPHFSGPRVEAPIARQFDVAGGLPLRLPDAHPVVTDLLGTQVQLPGDRLGWNVRRDANGQLSLTRQLDRGARIDDVIAQNPDAVARAGGPDAVRANPSLLAGAQLNVVRSNGQFESGWSISNVSPDGTLNLTTRQSRPTDVGE
ncbi:MAG: hypothetical protein JWM98_394, partial [Thermoleophilia bacterium]|nr:hypothetical protein [Thermoleophilia bacterium]